MKLIKYFFFATVIDLRGTLGSDFIIEPQVILDLVNSFNRPTAVRLHFCGERRIKYGLVKKVNQKRAIQILEDVASIRRRDLIDDKDILFIADLNCSCIKDFLEKSIALGLFGAPYRWILLDLPLTHGDVSPALTDLFIPTDSEVVVVREAAREYFQLNLIYKITADDEWRVEPYGRWNSTHGLQKSRVLTEVTAVRRKNLRGNVVSVAWVIQNNDSFNKFINKEDPHIDRITKATIVTGSFIVSFLNASHNYMYTNTWGLQTNNTWSGLSGMLARGEADLGASPMFFLPSRMLFSRYIACPTPTRTAFVFQQPPLSSSANIFLLSFTSTLWCGSSVLLSTLFLVLCVATAWEWKKKGAGNNGEATDTLRPNISDVGMLVVGATCQQGSTVELKGPSGRIVLLLLFLALTFLYTSFCANIVALLQSSSAQIKTLQDLLDSNMKFGVENLAWTKTYFMMQKEPTRKSLYEKKIAPYGEIQNFLSLEEGVKEMKMGQYAFFMELGVGYRAVGKYLEEHEKCNLEEVPYIQQPEPYVTARKDSPFLEMFRIGYARIGEHGLQARENLLMYRDKPKCSGTQTSFVSVSLVDCSPAFLVMACGALSAGLLCVFENLYCRVKMRYYPVRTHVPADIQYFL